MVIVEFVTYPYYNTDSVEGENVSADLSAIFKIYFVLVIIY